MLVWVSVLAYSEWEPAGMWRSLFPWQAGGRMCTYVNVTKTVCLAGGGRSLLGDYHHRLCKDFIFYLFGLYFSTVISSRYGVDTICVIPV